MEGTGMKRPRAENLQEQIIMLEQTIACMSETLGVTNPGVEATQSVSSRSHVERVIIDLSERVENCVVQIRQLNDALGSMTKAIGTDVDVPSRG